jgi:kynurenine formamidase
MTPIKDLTQPISPRMPVYPGTEPPVLHQANTVERDGFAEIVIHMGSHTGTHVDAPAHMVAGAPTLDRMGVDRFVGRACVIDVSGAAGGEIGASDLERHAGLVAGCEFVLLHTGWSRYWGEDKYYSGFPVLSTAAIRWLLGRSLKGIGLDAISIDPVGATRFANHLECFAAGLILVENLTDLGALVGRRFTLSCLPLALPDADGSPVRAVALLDE